jgi:hypothetical protein
MIGCHPLAPCARWPDQYRIEIGKVFGVSDLIVRHMADGIAECCDEFN